MTNEIDENTAAQEPSNFETEIHMCLINLMDEIRLRIAEISESKNDELIQLEIKQLLTILSNHFSAFLASACFDLLNDPENWLKHTFYDSLKHVNILKKEAINSVVKAQEETQH